MYKILTKNLSFPLSNNIIVFFFKERNRVYILIYQSDIIVSFYFSPKKKKTKRKGPTSTIKMDEGNGVLGKRCNKIHLPELCLSFRN